MALSVLVVVGDAQSWVPELIQRAKALKIGNGFEPDMDLGPVISPAAKERIEGLIASCEKEGGKILLDGRGAKVDGYPNGNWVGPTVLECTPDMTCYKQEIFGPGQPPSLGRNLMPGSALRRQGRLVRPRDQDHERQRVGQRRLDLHPERRDCARVRSV